MGNRLFRIVYWNGNEHNGIALLYAKDTVEARDIHVQQRSNPILSITPMPGGFLPGGYACSGYAERVYLPPKEITTTTEGAAPEAG
jgi:hypothetical protein